MAVHGVAELDTTERLQPPQMEKGWEKGGSKGGKKQTEAWPRAGAEAGRGSGKRLRAVSRAPPITDKAWGFLSRTARVCALRMSAPEACSQLRPARPRPSRGALTPEEALASSSSSPLQAGDVGLTARSQKVAPSAACSSLTAALSHPSRWSRAHWVAKWQKQGWASWPE